jgi:hypothetical protein
MASRDVLSYLSVMIGTFIIGSIVGLFLLLASYTIMTTLLSSGLLPKDSFFYGSIFIFIGAVKLIIGRLTGLF